MSESKTVSFRNVWRIGGAIIAFIIGSGFATGQEILQFFTVYGTSSMVGILVAAILLSIISAILIKFGHRSVKLGQRRDPFNYYLGRVFGPFMRYFTPFNAFLINTIMISGAGAIMNQYFSLPQWVGTLGMTILVYVATQQKLTRLIDVLGTLGPITIAFTAVVGLWTVLFGQGSLDGVNQTLAAMPDLNYAVGQSSAWWLLGAILYVAYTFCGSIPFLNAVGLEARSKKEAIYGGIFGGVGLMFGAFVLNLAMLMNIETATAVEVPVLTMAENIHWLLGLIFTFILVQETFSTSAPMVWTVVNAFDRGENFTPQRRNLVVLGVNVLSLIGAQLPFGELINIIYPFTGYFGLVMIVLAIGKEIKDIRRGVA